MSGTTHWTIPGECAFTLHFVWMVAPRDGQCNGPVYSSMSFLENAVCVCGVCAPIYIPKAVWCVCVYIYMYVYVYIYTHTHTHTHNQMSSFRSVSSTQQRVNWLRSSQCICTMEAAPSHSYSLTIILLFISFKVWLNFFRHTCPVHNCI